jgi:TfoX/Sxy family transcriptional regulator of competence genes
VEREIDEKGRILLRPKKAVPGRCSASGRAILPEQKKEVYGKPFYRPPLTYHERQEQIRYWMKKSGRWISKKKWKKLRAEQQQNSQQFKTSLEDNR